jgi:signal transduction histidine kinase
MVVEISDGLASVYLMRAVYLAIAGYLIGFFGQQRVNFERRLRELETDAERETIARSLHDGYLQALAAVSLRLESCRDMLCSNDLAAALAEIKEIQLGVSREYDEVREYVHSLVAEERPVAGSGRMDLKPDPRFKLHLPPRAKLSSTSCKSFSRVLEIPAVMDMPVRE